MSKGSYTMSFSSAKQRSTNPIHKIQHSAEGSPNLTPFDDQFNFEKPHTSNRKEYGNDQIIIKFVGNMKENTEDLLYQLNCTCGTFANLRYVLEAYAGKIQKLRDQRNFYKNTFIQHKNLMTKQIEKLNEKIKFLTNQNLNLKHKKTVSQIFTDYEQNGRISQNNQEQFDETASEQESKQYTFSQNYTSKDKLQESNLMEESNHNYDPPQILRDCKVERELANSSVTNLFKKSNSVATINEQQFNKLIRKYNISSDQLEQIFQQYDTDKNENIDDDELLFEQPLQRQLYQLGKKMEKDLINKKSKRQKNQKKKNVKIL